MVRGVRSVWQVWLWPGAPWCCCSTRGRVLALVLAIVRRGWLAGVGQPNRLGPPHWLRQWLNLWLLTLGHGACLLWLFRQLPAVATLAMRWRFRFDRRALPPRACACWVSCCHRYLLLARWQSGKPCCQSAGSPRPPLNGGSGAARRWACCWQRRHVSGWTPTAAAGRRSWLALPTVAAAVAARQSPTPGGSADHAGCRRGTQ